VATADQACIPLQDAKQPVLLSTAAALHGMLHGVAAEGVTRKGLGIRQQDFHDLRGLLPLAPPQELLDDAASIAVLRQLRQGAAVCDQLVHDELQR